MGFLIEIPRSQAARVYRELLRVQVRPHRGFGVERAFDVVRLVPDHLPDPHDLAACLNRLSSDAELRRELGQAAIRRSRRFRLTKQTAAMRGVYDKAALAMAER